ncbi:TonB-dependent receptor [[Pseudomonas] boreopolis]|uniref:TonB-dependent receptor n=1 Tax=Xanthomonas boreopolis TaxID=86183 RepID=UPI003D9FCB01
MPSAPDTTAPVAAQDHAAKSGISTLDSVEVTANRRTESVRDVPMSIDVVTSEDLYKDNLLDAKDITKLAPGLEMTNNDGRQNVASLRGVSFNPDTGVSVAAVGMYVNDVPVDANVAFNALYDLGQIEVLRGPQGTLRGQMTPAGAITMTTAKPDLGAMGGEIQSTSDNKGGHNYRGAFNLPLVQDRLALRFAAVKDENEGNHVQNITNGRRSHNDTRSYRLSLGWQVTDELKVDLMSQKLDVTSIMNKQVIGDGVVTPFSLGRAARQIDLDDLYGVTDASDRYDTAARLTTLNATYDLDERHSLSFVASYQDYDLDQGFDRDIGNVLPDTVIWQQTNTSVKQKTAELVLSSSANDYWSYTAGVYYAKIDSQTGVDVASNVQIDAPGGSTSKAVFSRQTIRFNDKWSFDFGFRYSELTSDRQSSLTYSGYDLGPTVPDKYAHVVDKPLTWGLSLRNRFTDQTSGYVSLAHSFRPGTYQVAVFNPISADLLYKGPEKSDTLEIGSKSLFNDGKLSLNVAAFGQRYKGFIDLVSEVSYQYISPFTGETLRDVSPLNSSGDADVYGIESQLAARFTPNWDFNASVSWVKSRYTSGQAPCDDSNGDGVPDSNGPSLIPAGQQVAFCPLRGAISNVSPFSATVDSEYRFDADRVQPYIGARVNFRAGYHSDKSLYDYPSFTNLSLYAGVRSYSGSWEVGLFVKNALDQRRITNYSPTNMRTPIGSLGLFDAGYREIVSTVPRTVGLTARYSF